MHPKILDKYEQALQAALGAITVHRHVISKESSMTIRQCSQSLDSMSVELRKQLVQFDKSLKAHIGDTH